MEIGASLSHAWFLVHFARTCDVHLLRRTCMPGVETGCSECGNSVSEIVPWGLILLDKIYFQHARAARRVVKSDESRAHASAEASKIKHHGTKLAFML